MKIVYIMQPCTQNIIIINPNKMYNNQVFWILIQQKKDYKGAIHETDVTMFDNY